MLDTQKWKIVEGPHGNQILSVVRNTQRLDSLKIIQTGTDLLCCKVKRGGQPIWSFGDNVAPAQAPAPAGNTILVFNAPGVRNIEQEKTNRDHILNTMQDEVSQTDELINKLNKEKKHIAETQAKSNDDMITVNEKVGHLNSVKNGATAAVGCLMNMYQRF